MPDSMPAKRSLAWLWVTLAAVVVLVVGAAAAVAVVRPWDDDRRDLTVGEPYTIPFEPSDQAGDTEPDTAPSSPETSAPPPPTAAPGPVTADLDGDGFGDAAVVVGAGDAIDRLLLSSTGSSFKVGRRAADAFEDRTWADFDGDGTLDQISWSYELSGDLTLTSDDMDFEELNLRLRLEEDQPFVTLKPGDFDGDGAVDLVAYGTSVPETVSVWVIRNLGGRFAEPEEWMRLPGSSYALTTVLPADFNADGLTDVAVRLPQELPARRGDEVRFGFSLLLSTGSAFLPGPRERTTAFADTADAVVGDFSADGNPRVLLIGAGRNGVVVRALRRSGDRLVLDRRLLVQAGGAGEVVDAVVSDVNGDRVDDVVYTTSRNAGEYGGFRVMSLADARIEPGEVWAATPRCRARDCSFYFQNSF